MTELEVSICQRENCCRVSDDIGDGYMLERIDYREVCRRSKCICACIEVDIWCRIYRKRRCPICWTLLISIDQDWSAIHLDSKSSSFLNPPSCWCNFLTEINKLSNRVELNLFPRGMIRIIGTETIFFLYDDVGTRKRVERNFSFRENIWRYSDISSCCHWRRSNSKTNVTRSNGGRSHCCFVKILLVNYLLCSGWHFMYCK